MFPLKKIKKTVETSLELLLKANDITEPLKSALAHPL